jgi:hypothetical protein
MCIIWNQKDGKNLVFFGSKDLEEIKELITEKPNLNMSKSYLLSKNFGQWFKHLKLFIGTKNTILKVVLNKFLGENTKLKH